MARRAFGTVWLTLWVVGMLPPGGRVNAQTDAPRRSVSLHEEPVFHLYRGEGSLSLEDRARQASQALTLAASEAEPQVQTVREGDVVIVRVGDTPVVQLREEDARLAGDATLALHAAGVAARVGKAVESERKRVSIANTVFSVSLVVFFGLITVYLLGRVRQLTTRARSFVVAQPGRIPALRLKGLDVVGPVAVRNGVLVFLSVARWLSLFGLTYAWLVLSLSLFEATRPYTERLTGIVLSPLTALVGRVASGLPLFAIIAVGAVVVALLVRISDLFFQSVDRGETHVGWLSPETALPTGMAVRTGIVLFALIVVAPVITGQNDGALSRVGMVLFGALAAASVPALASVLAGMTTTFSRALGPGDLVEYGGERGRVREVGLFSLVLDGEGGLTIRVPHARSLWHATRVLERRAR